MLPRDTSGAPKSEDGGVASTPPPLLLEVLRQGLHGLVEVWLSLAECWQALGGQLLTLGHSGVSWRLRRELSDHTCSPRKGTSAGASEHGPRLEKGLVSLGPALDVRRLTSHGLLPTPPGVSRTIPTTGTMCKFIYIYYDPK